MTSLRCFFIFSLGCAAFSGVIAKPPQKIAGGTEAFQSQFPYQVSLRLKNNFHFCGGSIISVNYIVTAAHCVEDKNYYDIWVAVGTNSRATGTLYKIKKCVMHEKYEGAPNHFYDIAILELSIPLTTNTKNWKLINLASKNYESGYDVVISGWGYTPTHTAQNLRFIRSKLADISLCAPYYNNLERTLKLCILGRDRKTTCEGDSGGPVVIGSELVGIVSSGFCGNGVSIFTRIYAVRDFIRRETGI